MSGWNDAGLAKVRIPIAEDWHPRTFLDLLVIEIDCHCLRIRDCYEGNVRLYVRLGVKGKRGIRATEVVAFTHISQR